MLRWHWFSFSELDTQNLYNILALRQEVFVIEQKCIYRDLDYLDQESMHLLGKQDDQLLAYLRVLPINVAYPQAISIGRVVTAPTARAKGLAKAALQQALLYLEKNGNQIPIIISAQLYLQKFYESFGFHTQGNPYDEDGILHIKMKRS